jgi:two-component system sensor histidine kinase/response regulator
VLSSFFISGPIPTQALHGTYNLALVILSYLVAGLASYLALILARYLVKPKNSSQRYLLQCGGALALGAGIWSMHFIGMLAFSMEMPIGYDPWLTVLSLLIAVLSAYGVLAIISRPRLKIGQIISSAVLLGIGISAMHYVGMLAMSMATDMRYRLDVFLLSIAIAIVASGAALWICFTLARHSGKGRWYLEICAASIMAAAICGMHYTGMAAAVFMPRMDMGNGHSINSNGIALAMAIIGCVLCIILPIVVFQSIKDDQETDDSASSFPTKLLSLTVIGTFGALAWIGGYSLHGNYLINEAGMTANELHAISNSFNWIAVISISVALVLAATWYFALRSIRQWRCELHNNKTLLRTILDNMPLALFAKDASNDYRWLLLNRMAEDMFCLESKNVVGRADGEFFPKKEADFFHQTDVSVMAGRKLVDIEAEPVTTPKGTFMAHTIKVPIYDENGEPHILLGMCEDTTEKFKAKEELRQAKVRAEQADRAKSDFLANMSHELRTPLNSILGMTRLLQESGITGEQRTLTETVFASSATLLEIVNDILDLSKIEAGALELENIGTDLSYVLESVVDRLNPLAREKNLPPLAVENSPSPYVLADPARLTRILTNLVSNAIKYTNHGSIRIKTSHHLQDGTHIIYRCEIIDTGIGIPADKHASIFEKFTQADTSTTRKYGGTGLGLAITKQLVELMGGSIGLTSDLNKGSTFWFEISFSITGELYQEKRNLRDTITYSSIPPAEARVLVAEDHAMNQAFIRKFLERLDIKNFKIADNGVDAVEAYRTGHWDIILMDCHMPEKNGYDATIEIRSIEKTTGAHVPIIAMTANAMIGDREKCLRCGMDDYISKPIVIDELTKLMGQWIELEKYKWEIPAKVHAAQNCIDLTEMRTFTGGDKNLDRDLIRLFIEQSEKNLHTMTDNQIDGANLAWVEAAHMLKGGAAGIGARALCTFCSTAQEMETASAIQRATVLVHIRQAYDTVKEELRNEKLLN